MWDHGGDIYGAARYLGCRPEEILDFSANISPFGLPPSVRRAIIENLDCVINYPQPGNPDLVSAIAGYLNVREENIIPGNGATELIYLTVRAINPGKALLVAPCFSEYERALQAVRSRVDYFYLREENEFILDVKGLLNRMSDDYDMFILCNPNNPTGTVIGLHEMERIIKGAVDKGIYVVIDEAFMDFIAEEDRYSVIRLIGEYKNLVVIRAFTKFFGMPGLRLGYGLVSSRVLKLGMESIKEPWSVNLLAEKAGIAVLQDKGYINGIREWIARERDFLYRCIQGIGLLKPYRSFANFILFRIDGEDINSGALKKLMLERGILVRDASNFEGLNDKFIRVAVKSREANLSLINALKEIMGKEGSGNEG
jgi:threonine-phosphate decarboxylase